MKPTRSKRMTHGPEKAPHRSLLHALGLTREEIDRPLIGIVNSANEVVPGHLHLDRIAEAVKAGVSNYIVKPFTAETLSQKIEQVFNK